MGTLYLVRHGQASFGAADYDQLSDLGRRQAVRLGEYFADQGIRFDALLLGSLRRHAQTLDGIAEGLGLSAEQRQAALVRPGLNEYDSAAVIAAVHPEPLQAPRSAEEYRHHFRLLREGLGRWMSGASQPKGMPSYDDFVAGVAEALTHVRQHHHGGKVLVVSSGGPISTAVGHVLDAPAASTIELNLRIRNSSVTEFAFTPKRHMLVTYNTLPHLDGTHFRDWITYS